PAGLGVTVCLLTTRKGPVGGRPAVTICGEGGPARAGVAWARRSRTSILRPGPGVRRGGAGASRCAGAVHRRSLRRALVGRRSRRSPGPRPMVTRRGPVSLAERRSLDGGEVALEAVEAAGPALLVGVTDRLGRDVLVDDDDLGRVAPRL